MCLLIFAPLFFLNVDGVPDAPPDSGGNKILPAMTGPSPASNRPQGNLPADAEPPTNRTPPADHPDANSIDPN